MLRRLDKTETGRYLLKRFKRSSITAAVEEAANQAREPLLSGLNQFFKIPVDVYEVARNAGIRIDKSQDISDLIDGSFSYDRYGFVASTAQRTARRDRLTLAHEIGHSLFRSGQKHRIASLNKMERIAEERICMMFANALLMPKYHMHAITFPEGMQRPWEVFATLERSASIFQVSLPALILRLGQAQPLHPPSLILLCLSFAKNPFRQDQPRLRTRVCTSLGDIRGARTWYNRSASGLGLNFADALFKTWAIFIAASTEPTGGRYTLEETGKLVRASPMSLHWIDEELNVSIFNKGLWTKTKMLLRSASCLYAKRGWNCSQAYIVTIIRDVEKDRNITTDSSIRH